MGYMPIFCASRKSARLTGGFYSNAIGGMEAMRELIGLYV